jgi:hypothetical protein
MVHTTATTNGTLNSKNVRFILLGMHNSKIYGSYHCETQTERTRVNIYGSYYCEYQTEHNRKNIQFMLLGTHNSKNIRFIPL